MWDLTAYAKSYLLFFNSHLELVHFPCHLKLLNSFIIAAWLPIEWSYSNLFNQTLSVGLFKVLTFYFYKLYCLDICIHKALSTFPNLSLAKVSKSKIADVKGMNAFHVVLLNCALVKS